MLDSLFSPKSIVVIGASRSPEKLGHVIVKNLLTNGYTGRIYPVNPKGGKVLQRKAYESVALIPTSADLAVIVIPGPFVEQALKECGKKKIKNVIIISAGFSEAGKEGKQLEEKIVATAKKFKMRILGPNCLGIIVPRKKMNASFAQGLPDVGSVAVISQSGAMAVAITDWALSTGIGFSGLVSLGNKSDIHEEDLLKYFAKDSSTKVITMYLESLATGRSFLRTLKRVTKSMPVIILKPGRSEKAQHAVTSHTGAIAGSHKVERAALQRAGAIVVDTLEELFSLAILFERKHSLKGNKIAVVTNAGGPGILMTDALTSQGFVLSDFSNKTKKVLHAKLPPTASIANPIDVVGDAPASRYRVAITSVLKDRNVDAVITLLTHQYVTETEKVAKILIAARKENPKKPILASFIGGDGVQKGRHILQKADIPQFDFPDQAAKALRALLDFDANKGMPKSFPDVLLQQYAVTHPALGLEAERVAKMYIPFLLPSKTEKTISGALRSAKRLGYPVVAKIVSSKFVHKTDTAVVKINIQNEKDLKRILQNWHKTLQVDFTKDEGYYIQPYTPGTLEVFVGAKRDPQIGPYLVVGVGGIFVEAFENHQIHTIPLTRRDIADVVMSGDLGKIFLSKRGKGINRSTLISIISGVSKMMLHNPQILECDLNPVILSKEMTSVADIRLVIAE